MLKRKRHDFETRRSEDICHRNYDFLLMATVDIIPLPGTNHVYVGYFLVFLVIPAGFLVDVFLLSKAITRFRPKFFA
jgi:hypothetical protein